MQDFSVIQRVATVTGEGCSLTFSLSREIPRLTLTGDGELVYQLTAAAETLPTFELYISANDGSTHTIFDNTVVVVKRCTSQLVETMARDRQFFIPESGSRQEIVYAASDFATFLPEGCGRTFRMEPEYNDLRINANTGLVTLTNKAKRASYTYDIIVSHTGGAGVDASELDE
jgi:hypothetical protein